MIYSPVTVTVSAAASRISVTRQNNAIVVGVIVLAAVVVNTTFAATATRVVYCVSASFHFDSPFA